MPASILQLQTKGEQDAHLTGNPNISFFKYVYKRHTPFALEMMEIVFNDQPGWGKKSYCNIPRKGDLLAQLFLQIRLPKLFDGFVNQSAQWCDYLGFAMIDIIEILIGGQCIDKVSGEWLYIQSQLSNPYGKKSGLDFMVGSQVNSALEKVLYIPLTFWFNRHYAQALPLINLQFHEIRLNVHFKKFHDVTINADEEIPLHNVTLLAEYIFLDIPERLHLQNNDQEYIIDTLQMSQTNATSTLQNSIDIAFVHPVKELIWVIQRSDFIDASNRNWFKYDFHSGLNPMEYVTLKINDNERITKLPGEFFNLIVPFQHHSNIPDNTGIMCFSFAIHPESIQPTGTMNFSLIDEARIVFQLNPSYFLKAPPFVHADVRVYGVSVNVLRVKNGTAQLVFAT